MSLTSGKIPIATGANTIVDSTSALLSAAGVAVLDRANTFTALNTFTEAGGLRFLTTDGSLTKAFGISTFEFAEVNPPQGPCREMEIGFNIYQDHQLNLAEHSCWLNFEHNYDLYPSSGNYFETHLSYAPPGFNPGYTATITTKALTSNVATITLSAAHTLVVGQNVIVALSTPDSTFDGTQLITAVTGTTFSFAKTHADVVSIAAAGTLTSPTWSHAWYSAWDRANNRISRTFLTGLDISFYAQGTYDGGTGTPVLALSSTQAQFNVPGVYLKGTTNGLYLSWEAASKPTVDPSGNALTQGMRWYESGGNSSGQWWIWDSTVNGGSWVSEQRYQYDFSVLASNTTDGASIMGTAPGSGTYDYYLENFESFAVVSTTNTGSHYWTVNLQDKPAARNLATITTVAVTADTWDKFGSASYSNGTYIACSAIKALMCYITKTGTPGAVNLAPVLTYRLVHR